MYPIQYPLSKIRLAFLFIGALIFVLIGISFIWYPNFIPIRQRQSIFVVIISLIAILFFGVCMIAIFIKLLDTKSGLIIDERGITDNTAFACAGFIDWDDIVDIVRYDIKSSKFLLVYVKDVDKYVERQSNSIIKSALKLNNNYLGTPVAITSISLKIRFKELETVVLSEYKKMKKH